MMASYGWNTTLFSIISWTRVSPSTPNIKVIIRLSPNPSFIHRTYSLKNSVAQRFYITSELLSARQNPRNCAPKHQLGIYSYDKDWNNIDGKEINNKLLVALSMNYQPGNTSYISFFPKRNKPKFSLSFYYEQQKHDDEGGLTIFMEGSWLIPKVWSIIHNLFTRLFYQ